MDHNVTAMAYLLQGPSTTGNKTTTHRTHRTLLDDDNVDNGPERRQNKCTVTVITGTVTVTECLF